MSRIGKKPITIPADVEVKIAEQEVEVKGPKGTLKITIHPHVQVVKDGQILSITVKDENNVDDRALWGLTAALLINMITGVTKGFSKKLEVNGIGYKVALQGKGLHLDLGYSHPIDFVLPPGITALVEKNLITISGIDKYLVGETSAQLRRLRKPEPYKGKGIKYLDEVVRRKAGKTAKTAAK